MRRGILFCHMLPVTPWRGLSRQTVSGPLRPVWILPLPAYRATRHRTRLSPYPVTHGPEGTLGTTPRPVFRKQTLIIKRQGVWWHAFEAPLTEQKFARSGGKSAVAFGEGWKPENFARSY